MLHNPLMNRSPSVLPLGRLETTGGVARSLPETAGTVVDNGPKLSAKAIAANIQFSELATLSVPRKPRSSIRMKAGIRVPRIAPRTLETYR